MSRSWTLGRLPIRLKLTLLFAVVMALVLTTTGMFLYFRLKSELDRYPAQYRAFVEAYLRSLNGSGR